MNADKLFICIILMISIIVAFTYAAKSEPKLEFQDKKGVFIDTDNKRKVVSDIDNFDSELERICCKTLSKIYNLNFKPQKLWDFDFICYNDAIKMAIEYRDSSHYEYPNNKCDTKKDFKKLFLTDIEKNKLCEENGIYLIIVPHNVVYDEIPEFIMERIPENI